MDYDNLTQAAVVPNVRTRGRHGKGRGREKEDVGKMKERGRKITMTDDVPRNLSNNGTSHIPVLYIT